MSDEPTERDVEALAATICAGRTATGPVMGRGMTWEACGYKDKFRTEARLFLESDWLTQRDEEARREGAAEALIADEVTAINALREIRALLDETPAHPNDGLRTSIAAILRAALRGDA